MHLPRKILFAISLLIFSCADKETVKGDLFVKLVDFGSYYGMDDVQIERFDKYLDSVQESTDHGDDQKEFYHFISRVKKNGLIKNPHIYLRLPSDSVVRIYLSEPEYDKVKDYTLRELQKKNQKVEIELEFVKKDEGLYYSDHILHVNEVEGQTPWDK